MGSYNQDSFNKGFLQLGVLTKRGSYNKRSYNYGVVATKVLTTRGLKTRG